MVHYRIGAEKEHVSFPLKIETIKNSLVVQWLGLCTLIADGPVSIPGQGTKIPIPHAAQCGKKKKKKKLFERVNRSQIDGGQSISWKEIVALLCDSNGKVITLP